MELIVDTELPAVASWALGELSRVLEARGEATPGVSRAGKTWL